MRDTKIKNSGFYLDVETSDEETARSDDIETGKYESENVKSEDGNAEIHDVDTVQHSINALVVSQRKKRKAVTNKRKTGYKFCVTIRITAL